ncbi:hypothetical protein AO368_0160 [Moraxella catarrhalis]|nr:hypothetical protein AO368_0160 [Moraxella catarrhalis]
MKAMEHMEYFLIFHLLTTANQNKIRDKTLSRQIEFQSL